MKINIREKRILIWIGAGILFLLYYLFILSPSFSKISKIKELVSKNESQLAEMKKLKTVHDRYNASKKASESILIERGQNFAILSYLENESSKLKIGNRIGYMKPVNFPPSSDNLQLAGIEMNLVGINTNELIHFLHKIEASGKLLSISRIKIQRPAAQGPQLLNATFQVNTYNYQGQFPAKPKPVKPATADAPPQTGIADSINVAIKDALKKPNYIKNDTEFISFIYLSVLAKYPSSKHLTYWVKKLQNGKTREEIILNFFETDEYRYKNKNAHDFIVDVYITVLNRIPDVSEVNAWIPRLQKGEQRKEIIEAFFTSPEYQKTAVKNASWFKNWLRFLN